MKQATLVIFLLYGCNVHTAVRMDQNENLFNIANNTTAEYVATSGFVPPEPPGTFWLDTVIGMSYLVLAVVATSLYVPCLIVIYRQCQDPTQPSSCYQLMFVMGIADLFQILALGYAAGLMTVVFSNIPVIVGKFWGALLSTSSQVYCCLLLLVAFNRYLCICRGKQSEAKLFGPILTKRWLMAIFGCSIAYFFLCLSPPFGLHYLRQYNTYHWGPERWNHLLLIFCAVFNVIVALFGSIFYVKIMLNIRAKRNAVTTEAFVASMQQKERNVLKSFALTFGFFSSGVMYWFLVAPWLQGNTYLAMYVAHMVWYTNACINPFVYLTINTTIQNGVRQLFLKDPGSMYGG